LSDHHIDGFHNSELTGDVTLADPPLGPPLLDNAESDLLDTFFKNPNNLDPSFLTNDYTQMNIGVYGSDSLSWMNNSTPSFGQAYSQTRQYAVPRSDQGRSNYGEFTQGPAQLTTSEDVYEAARLLHNNQNGRNSGSSNQRHYSAPTLQYSREGERQGVLQYPPPPSNNHTPYDFTSSNAYGMYYAPNQSKNGLHSYSKPSSVRKESSTSSRPDEHIRRQSITFGSDDKFRQTHYAGQILGEAPDKELEHGLIGGLRYDRGGSNSATPAPDQSGTKRGRAEYDPADEDEESAEEATPPPSKRRKRKAEEDDEEFGVKKTKAKSHKARRSSSPGRTSNARRMSSVTDTNKRSKLSPGDMKGNRENLSEEQKRNNHIQSEQKRRNLIKQGFEDLTKMVPELRAGGFSKSNMLLEAAKFMKVLRDGNDRLRAQLQSLDAG